MTNRREELTQAQGIQCGELIGMHGEITMTHVLQAFKMGARWADSHPKNPWYKVSEKLPKVYKHIKYIKVLVRKGDNIFMAFYSPVAGFSLSSSFYIEYALSDITHWMEIPEIEED